jgi:undecaprenyl-diphosphatase
VTGLEGGLAPLLAWLAEHPGWAGAVIGLIAFLESLALVGLLVPGAVLMFMAGAAVGGSNLPILPMLLWAMAGAILGDGLSYWLGWHFRARLRSLPVIRRYPGTIAQAERLFYRHGGKSVVIGRFVGPVRPVIPAVVGMLGMPPGRFLLANVSSAVVWAPAYLLPGVVFGASLILALEVMGRLMAWLVILFGGFFLLRWLLPRIDRPLRLAGHRLARALGRRPPTSWRWLGLRPLHAPLRALRHRGGWLWWLAVVAIVFSAGHALLGASPQGWERGLVALADAHRSDLVRVAAWRVTQLGGLLPVLLAAAALAGFLWHHHQPRRALLVLAAVVLAAAGAYALKAGLGTPRPQGLSEGADFIAAFPSAHAAGIAALVTAWVVLLPIRGRYGRRSVITLGLVIGLGVGVTRVVLGVHWPLDVVGGLGLGVVCGALPGLAGSAERVSGHQSLVVLGSALVLVMAATLTEVTHWPDPLEAYPRGAQVPEIAADDWWVGAATLADRRLGLGGRRGWFTAQWLGGEAMPTGFDAGWQAPPRWRWSTTLRWLSPQPSVERLPVLPRWHAGRLPDVVRIQPAAEPGMRLVLRAWRGATTAQGPVWLVWIETVTVRGGVLLPRLTRVALDQAGREAVLGRAAERSALQRRDDRVPRYAPASLAAPD